MIKLLHKTKVNNVEITQLKLQNLKVTDTVIKI